MEARPKLKDGSFQQMLLLLSHRRVTPEVASLSVSAPVHLSLSLSCCLSLYLISVSQCVVCIVCVCGVECASQKVEGCN